MKRGYTQIKISHVNDIVKWYPYETAKVIGKRLGLLRKTVTQIANRNGVYKKDSCRFKKGHIPFNKGLKGYMGANRTSFKKGQKIYNHKPVGTIVKRRQSDGTYIRLIKISDPSKWQIYARYVWEKNNGKIPKGMIVRHIDGNPLHDNISNLKLITRAENLLSQTVDKEKKSRNMRRAWRVMKIRVKNGLPAKRGIEVV